MISLGDGFVPFSDLIACEPPRSIFFSSSAEIFVTNDICYAVSSRKKKSYVLFFKVCGRTFCCILWYSWFALRVDATHECFGISYPQIYQKLHSPLTPLPIFRKNVPCMYLFRWPFTMRHSNFSSFPAPKDQRSVQNNTDGLFVVFLTGELFFWPALLKASLRHAGVSEMNT